MTFSVSSKIFLDRVKLACPECPTPIARDAILTALTKFFTESRVWKDKSQPYTILTADISGPYTLYPPGILSSATHIVSVDYVLYDSKKIIRPAAWRFLENTYPNWQTQSGDTPRWFVTRTTEVDKIYFYPAPDATNIGKTFVAEIAIAPSRNTDNADYLTLPNVMSDERWFNTIVAGALADLFLIPSHWADGSKAKVFRADFMRGISMAKMESGVETMKGSLRVQNAGFI